MSCVQCGRTDKRTETNRKDCNRCSNLWKCYRITHQQYENLLAEQNNQCKICSKAGLDGTPLAVDHCHTTGRIRGLLCSNCNTAIGLLYDNKELLQNAINYLK
jgi:hypothetical protein